MRSCHRPHSRGIGCWHSEKKHPVRGVWLPVEGETIRKSAYRAHMRNRVRLFVVIYQLDIEKCTDVK